MFSLLSRRAIQRSTHTLQLRCLASEAPHSETASHPLSREVSHLPSLDFQPEQKQERTTRTGAKSSKNSLSSIEQRRRIWARCALGILVVGVGAELLYLGREWDPEELKNKKIVGILTLQALNGHECFLLDTCAGCLCTVW